MYSKKKNLFEKVQEIQCSMTGPDPIKYGSKVLYDTTIHIPFHIEVWLN